jgi:hypothetical protein
MIGTPYSEEFKQEAVTHVTQGGYPRRLGVDHFESGQIRFEGIFDKQNSDPLKRMCWLVRFGNMKVWEALIT